MARLRRLSVAGHPHLLLLRGLEPRPIVVDDDDRRACLAALREASLQRGAAVHGYALLDDRLRLLATPRDAGSLGQFVQDFGRRYVGGFNRRHGRRGPLWDGRFRATVVQPGALALDALLFVEGEPARAGLVDEALAFRWSSAAHHVGRLRDPTISVLAEYWQLGNTPFERESAYAQRLGEGLPAHVLQRFAAACDRGWAVGDPAFLERLAGDLQRPVQPRPRGRPAKVGQVRRRERRAARRELARRQLARRLLPSSVKA
jgi:putative transposase